MEEEEIQENLDGKSDFKDQNMSLLLKFQNIIRERIQHMHVEEEEDKQEKIGNELNKYRKNMMQLIEYQNKIYAHIHVIQLQENEKKQKRIMKKLQNYQGNGPKKKTKEIPGCGKVKPAYTADNLCTIDSIVNMFLCMDYISTIENHTLCHHKERCAKCILRSAICKTRLATGVKKYVSIPEITYNLQIFLGQHFCPKCKERFYCEGDKKKHMTKITKIQK